MISIQGHHKFIKLNKEFNQSINFNCKNKKFIQLTFRLIHNNNYKNLKLY